MTTQHPTYDPPTYGGTPQQEAHAEMVQIFGSEQPDRQWILTDYDVWERNPYYSGKEQQHPEDDRSHEDWKADQQWLATLATTAALARKTADLVDPDDCPF